MLLVPIYSRDKEESEAGMIDIDELIQFDKAGCEHSGCTFGIHTIPKIIAELRAAREVVEFFREWDGNLYECDIHQENVNECDCGYVKGLEVIKKYDEARRG